MFLRSFLAACIFTLFCLQSSGQGKKIITKDDYKIWKRSTSESISCDGKWITYTLESNQKTDPQVLLHSSQGAKILDYRRGTGSIFSYHSDYLYFTIKPSSDSLKAMRRRKVSKEDLPKDSLALLTLNSQSLRKIPGVVSFKVPRKWNGWFAYQQDQVTDSTSSSKRSKNTAYDLVVEKNDGSESFRFPKVSDYQLAEKGQKIAFISMGNDSTFLPGVYVFDATTKEASPIFRSKGTYKSLTWDEEGKQLAFISEIDTTKALIRPYSLNLWQSGQDSSRTIAVNSDAALRGELLVSEAFSNQFSKDGSKLYFGLKPFPVLQDTSLLEEEIVNVEVWSYNDPRLHTQQKIEKEQDLKKAYAAVFHINQNQIVTVGSENIPEITLGDEGNSQFVLGANSTPYQSLVSWEGFPYYKDLFIINNEDGSNQEIKKKVRGQASLSPKGKFAFWYDVVDSAWFTYEVSEGKIFKITQNSTVPFYREIHDTPSYPSSYGFATWTAQDEKILIYDRFDIWEVDPRNATVPRRITNNGRENKISYRYQKLKEDERFITKGQKLILRGFNETDKSSGYYELSYKPKAKVKTLNTGAFSYNNLQKAEKGNTLFFTKESFKEFPNYYVTDSKFKRIKQISDVNPQQSEYRWGDISLYHWEAFDGEKLEGMLVKPDNFDPNKKYPLLVNFYDKSSDGLHNHRDPYPHRSTMNYSFFTSRGYVIFNPNVHYKTGEPGESAYNCVVSGVEALIKEGFIDRDKIGVQGHSWGGYQVSYLVTKTDIFACAEAGAPVPNMISAYGGIRWWTGLSRMFQYEHTQSRIGGTLWEYPQRYIDNSPIFQLDKVNTPLLIMHNDADGHVPWYQGIELFVSLRRLGKPSWFLNYQGEPHWPLKEQNRIDFNHRMQQFFDHYLMDAPKPRWMKDGVPATKVGIDQALDELE